MFKLDVMGAPCPMPLIKLKKTLALEGVFEIEMIATDVGVLKDIPAFCEQKGFSVSVLSDTTPYRLWVKKGCNQHE